MDFEEIKKKLQSVKSTLLECRSLKKIVVKRFLEISISNKHFHK